MSYIGKVDIGSDRYAIGSTLYGECGSSVTAATAAKIITLSDFTDLIGGVTIYVKFVNGNSVTENVTLLVGSVEAKPVIGNCTCGANEILAFTYEYNESASGGSWRTHTCGGVLTLDSLNQALANLGPMKFKGVLQAVPNNSATTYPDSGNTILNGDVIAVGNKEYVYVDTDTTTHWHELGDETEYVKHSELTTTSISLLSWSGASVLSGVLTIPVPSTSSETVVTPVSLSSP